MSKRFRLTAEAACKGPWALLAVISMSTACAGSADIVRKNQFGGLVSYQPGEDRFLGLMKGDKKAKGLARDIMQEHCGSRGYEVVEEGKVVVGREEVSRSKDNGTTHAGESKGGGIASDKSSGETTIATRAREERRIRYKCGKAPSEYEPPPMDQNAIP